MVLRTAASPRCGQISTLNILPINALANTSVVVEVVEVVVVVVVVVRPCKGEPSTVWIRSPD